MTAARIREAFESVDASFTTDSAPGYWAPGFLGFVADHVRTYSTDRRYRLQLNASTVPCSSAIVTYMGVRYYATRTPNGTWTVEVSR